MKNQWVRRIGLLVAALAVVGALIFAFLPKPVEVDLATIEKGSLRVTVNEDGKTRVRERYVVSAPLAGELLRIESNAGDPVTASETLLAEIVPSDPGLLDARAVAEAEARVRAMEASLERTTPLLELARDHLEKAQLDYDRAANLYESGTITQQDFDNASTRLATQTEEVRAAAYACDIATFELEQARAALLHTIPKTPGFEPDSPSNVDEESLVDENGYRFRIFTPVDGAVLRVMQESAAVVGAGTPLIEIGDPADLEVEVDVLSSDAVNIRPGAVVFLEQWGGGNSLPGRVRVVEPSAFTKISALGVEEQRVNVIIDLLAPRDEHRTLGDAYRVEARIVTWEGSDLVLVPTSALFRQGGQWATFVIRQGEAITQAVEIGHRNDSHAEVLSGLEPGDQVILHPSDQIADGVEIKQAPGRTTAASP